MKLLNQTSKYLAILLLLLITVWAVLFYYAMLDEIYDSLDDGLENQKGLLIKRAAEDPSILSHTDFNKHIYNFTPISKNTYSSFKENYRDTLMFMENEQDFEPVRVYESAVSYQDSYYKLKVITSMVEEDDLIEDLVAYLIGLYVLLVVSILILNNLLLKRIWKPFYNLINQLRSYRIEKETPIKIPETKIEEFNLLNTTVRKLTKKSRDSYVAQKHFIENAAHELQTPLAISINKLELYLEKNTLDNVQSKDLATVLDNLGRLTRLNKSLLLLSKIENQQFVEEEQVNVTALAKCIVDDFEDLATHKGIKIEVNVSEELHFKMNEDLANILLTNLIKNALVHGQKNKTITINSNANSLEVKNYGELALKASALFSRFEKNTASKFSTGLGLAIAKAVADKYDINLLYSYEEQHSFKIVI